MAWEIGGFVYTAEIGTVTVNCTIANLILTEYGATISIPGTVVEANVAALALTTYSAEVIYDIPEPPIISDEFYAYHNLAYKTPIYLVEFEGEDIDYSNHPVGSPGVDIVWHTGNYLVWHSGEYLVWSEGSTVRQYLVDIRGASQRVMPRQGRASIGGVTFTLQDHDNEITALLATDPYYFHRKKTTVKVGYAGLNIVHFVTIMVGWITGIKLWRDGVNYIFSVTDPMKWMQRKIFRGAEDTPVTISGNPINIMLQVLTSTGGGTNGDYDTLAAANGLGIDDDYINVTAIEAVRDIWFPGPSILMSFSIDKRVQAKKWLETEIFKILNVYPVIDADGKFNIKPFKPPLPATDSVQSFDEDNIIGIPSYDFNLGDLINEVECHYDWDDVDSEFDTEDFYIESTSLNNRGPGKSPIKLESKGMTTALGGEDFFAKRKAKIFERYATPPPKITMSTWFTQWLTEAGDIVPVSHPILPNIESGTRGITNQRMEVVNRTINWKKGTVKIELLATGFEQGLYCQIAPSMTVVSGTSATEFEVSSADAAKFSVGDEIAMHYPNMLVQHASLTITNISGTTITTDNMGATPSAGWIAQYAVYDNCTSDQKLYWYASDGSDELGAANDPAHLITA